MLQIAERASKVRENFSQFTDSVLHERPGFMSRNRRDVIAMFSAEQLDAILDSIQFHATFEQDENMDFIGTLAEIEDLIICEPSKDEALTALARGLMEYAEDYLTDSFRRYFHAPNRRAHFPLVLKVALKGSIDEVKQLIIHA